MELEDQIFERAAVIVCLNRSIITNLVLCGISNFHHDDIKMKMLHKILLGKSKSWDYPICSSYRSYTSAICNSISHFLIFKSRHLQECACDIERRSFCGPVALVITHETYGQKTAYLPLLFSN